MTRQHEIIPELVAERAKLLTQMQDKYASDNEIADYKRQAQAIAAELKAYRTGYNGTHAQLFARCSHVIQSYRKDLTFHDYLMIADNPGRSFIHLTTETSTHIYMMPLPADDMDNEKIRILFGHGTRRKLHDGVYKLLKSHTFPADALWTHYNAKTGAMRTIEQDKAAELYRQSIPARR